MQKQRLIAALAGLVCGGAALAGDEPPRPGESLSFVACPMYRDTDTVPCWLAEHEGEMYFLGIQTDSGGWPSPWLGHKLLVEGTVADRPKVCGGIVLESSGTPFDRRPSGSADGIELPNPPVTSVMRELDTSCDTVLPMEERFNTLEPRRGPGPNVYRPPLTPEQRAAREAEAAARAEAARPKPPFQPKTFELHYEFDSELAVLTIRNTQDALEYAEAVDASAIKVKAYRGAARLSNGEMLAEFPEIARLRAREIENTLRKLGLPEGTALEVSWDDEVQPADGDADWEFRRTDIEVIP